MDETKLEQQFGLRENEALFDQNEVPVFGIQVSYLMGTGQYERVQVIAKPDPKLTIPNPEKYSLYAVKKPNAERKPTTVVTTTGKILSN